MDGNNMSLLQQVTLSCSSEEYDEIGPMFENEYPEQSPIELYQCILCEYKSSRKCNLKKHFMTHTKEKPFKCNDCNFCAATKSTLVLHVRTHTGERPYECGTCHRKFSRRNIIKAHIKTHTNEKPFKCSQCEFATSRKDNLNFHMRRHLADKPFNCHICFCSFVQKCRFIRHLEHHTKMYRCTACCFRTHLEANLLKHKLSHNKINLYICYLCGKGFNKRHGVRIHIKRHAREEYYALLENKLHGSSIESGHTHFIGKVPDKTCSNESIQTDDSNNLDTLANTSYFLGSNANNQLKAHTANSDVNVSSSCSHENLDFNSRDLEFHSSVEDLEQQPYSQDMPNSYGFILNNGGDDDMGFGSSSDSEIDSSFINTQSVFAPTVISTNSDVALNCQSNVNYILGSNVVQPLILPSVSLQPSLNLPYILTMGTSAVQVNQNLNFIPVYNGTNLFINNFVPNIEPSLMLNPCKTIFVNEIL